MASFQKKALESVVEHKINLLTQLKEKIRKLDQELETLNSMKEDTELRLREQEKQPGRRRKGPVDNWLKNVEQIKEERQDTMNQIYQILTYESNEEVFEEVLKEAEKIRERGLNPDEPSSSASHNHGLQIKGGKIFGMGGIGNTIIKNDGCTFNITFGKDHITRLSSQEDEDDEELE